MNLNTKDLIICAIFASITAILAQIAIPIPFSTVPLTMQVFAVAISGIILGSKRGFISMLIYVLLGAIGIPVFAQMSGGIGIIFGYTGGFIMAFPIMSLIIGYISEKYNKTIYIVLVMILSLAINYGIGTAWYSIVSGVGFKEGFMVCVAPFIFVDFIKIALATTIGITVKKRLKKEVFVC
ncbi:MAG: biotin transporter BioY [Paeniclostridium sp.]|uniref:biotin transporter BioY n=1 Tax=Paraclostridium sordellii TaxID=1505 RepID=UPI0005E01891|nr:MULTISPECIES: biotin transporter BioY [Paeniclostridium]MBW4861822.1 biotin transporter BioY [Paeniclostridium sp.]MBW4874889.1 biotin transporter BioY [Paeniclostridium sp.]MDU1455122.1 biotin transporter BioY [Paeniclostridium sordellii]CEN30190.1 BioY family protein [[Clostridium] sordellii] [Paeniclostridium sordellii]CEN30602.1 BioY family protein [[Clostridium] sordellii] [Paeniclostridium sordellii]